MAGTLFGLGLSQQHDVDGRPMSACRLYLYDANTSTPHTAYSNPSLAAGLELPWPIVANSAGRLPAFWLDDGAYRARLTDANGVVQFDEGNVLAVGSGTGDIITSNVPPESIFSTGMVTWMPEKNVKAGWVRLNGRTIGNTSSGASELANSTTALPLFSYLYGAFADALCPVSGGRTGNALNDFNAAKTLQLLDMRASAPFGLDDMGNTAAGWLTLITSFDAGGGPITGGSKGGAPFRQLLTANLPPYTPAGTIAAATITTKVRGRADTFAAGPTMFATNVANATSPDVTDSSVMAAPVFAGTPQGGAATAFETIPNFVLGTWFQKL